MVIVGHPQENAPMMKSWLPASDIARQSKKLPLRNADAFSENGHQLVRPSGGQGFTPVVGFGVVEVVQQANGVADGSEAAEEDMANGFVFGFLWNGRLRSRWGVAVRSEVLKHGDLVSNGMNGLGCGKQLGGEETRTRVSLSLTGG